MRNLRAPSSSILVAILLVFIFFRYCLHITDQSLGDLAKTSGWFLLASFLLLCLYGIRKKFPFLPLGKTSTWLLLHLTTGILSTYFFLHHTGYRIPTGTFDLILALGYLTILLSGVGGWILMRSIPIPLRDSMHLLPGRIAEERSQLIHQADEEIKNRKPGSSDIGYQDAYLTVLRPFLFRSPGFLPRGSKENHYLTPDFAARYARCINIAHLQPNSTEDKIHQLILRKAMLDRQLRLHRWMRGWMLVHLPLTGAMVMMITLHVVVVHGFAAGSAR